MGKQISKAVWMRILLAGVMGCAAPNPNVRVTRLPNSLRQVEGPLAGPFEKTETLAAAACQLFGSEGGPCLTHKYNYATRVVSALREGEWVPIGRA